MRKTVIQSILWGVLSVGLVLPISVSQASEAPAVTNESSAVSGSMPLHASGINDAELYSMGKGLEPTRKEQDAYVRREMSGQSTFAGYRFKAPQGWTDEIYEVGKAKAEHMVNPEGSDTVALLELHGGGYTLGLSERHRLLTARVGQLIGAKHIFLSDYRLAPKHTYPAALEDAVALYRHMLDQGIKAQNIVIYGDSAGGNLAVALALYARQHKLPQPAALVLASPWVNLESKAPSWILNDEDDLILGKGTPLNQEVKHSSYAGTLSFSDPRLSPVYADLTGLPPMLIQVGSEEVFLDDIVRFSHRAAQVEVAVTLSVYPTMSHDFALVVPKLEESQKSLREIRDFVKRSLF